MICQFDGLAIQTSRPSGIGFRLKRILLSSVLTTSVLLSGSGASAQAPAGKNVLILNEVGLSHALTAVAQEIAAEVQKQPGRNVEFYTESLDLITFPEQPSRAEVSDWLAKKYGGFKLDVLVAVGPDAVNFLANYSRSVFLNVPIVICGSAVDQAGNPKLDSRFTGSWVKLEPQKTIEVALRLFPNTRHVVVVGGSSAFDRVVLSLTREALDSFHTRADVSYLTDMEMGKLLEQLQHQPENSIVLYVSVFQDAAGNRFVNATTALPMVAAASNVPVFGMSDTYLGHGIVGGNVLSFQKQAKITAGIVSQLLDGQKAKDIPIETLPSVYTFDWRALERWQIPESNLPPGSVVLFREPSRWERTKWIWISSLLIILGLSALVVYLQHSRTQLKFAREKQRELSGMLINAGEKERTRLASELHDDFSQRLAVVALGLENVAEATPACFREVHHQLHELVNSTSEISADLHTLSHHLHSSTLETLGLVPALTALCKEYTSQHGMKIDVTSEGVPRSVHPDAALCIFRIAQEGLRNAKKHSGAMNAHVELRRSGDRLDISVSDKGRGFELDQLRSRDGLGLQIMQERARQLGGEFAIYSCPGEGTTVKAWVPLGSGVKSRKDEPR